MPVVNAHRKLPPDFGARLRAARAYADDLSREDFAAKLNTPTAGASNLKAYERGERQPLPLVAPVLIERLAVVSGLPEAFFWGDDADAPLSQRLSSIETALRDVQRELVVLAREESRQTEASDQPADSPRLRPRR